MENDKFAVSTDEGEVAVYATKYLPVYSFHNGTFAIRENLTDITV